MIDDEVVDTFARLMEDLPKPIVFYCGTGARCTILWTLAAAGRLGVDEALAVANKAGYDLDFLRHTLAERYHLPVVTAAQSSASALQARLVVSWPTRGDLYTRPKRALSVGVLTILPPSLAYLFADQEDIAWINR